MPKEPINPEDFFHIFAKPQKLTAKQFLAKRILWARHSLCVIMMPNDRLIYLQEMASETYDPK